MLAGMTNFNRFSIYDLRNLCEIAGIDPDGHRRESNRRRREESPRWKANPDASNTRAPSESLRGTMLMDR